jgi:hypothetical protein
VHAAFLRAGYAASQPSAWAAGAVVFMVRDPAQTPADRPVLRVFVFADAAEHRQAQAREEVRRNRTMEENDDHGPQFLTGYGASVWRGNVALVQASPREDVGSFPVEPNCDPEPVITADSPPERASRDYLVPSSGVDRRFVELVEALL